MKKFLASVLLTALIMPGQLHAASPWTEGVNYLDKITGKLDFGMANLLGGWTEIYTEPQEAQLENRSRTKAALKGTANAFIFTLGGLVHTATFFIPVDLPLPDNGVPLPVEVKTEDLGIGVAEKTDAKLLN